MLVNGRDCSIVIKTSRYELDVPYSSETVREAISLLYEEPSIEGDGVVRVIRKPGGVTGCVVTPLTIETAPLLLYLAFGAAGMPLFVSETRNVYQRCLSLLPLEDTDCFDLAQDRNGERKLFEGCKARGFELRITRGETIHLKLDISGDRPAIISPRVDIFPRLRGEIFNGDNAAYTINGVEYRNIYGVTLIAKKAGGTKTELWIRRLLEQGRDLPGVIDELTITAWLRRDSYEARRYGMFRVTVENLVMIADETEIDNAGAIIGPLRYYAAGTVSAEVFASGEAAIA